MLKELLTVAITLIAVVVFMGCWGKTLPRGNDAPYFVGMVVSGLVAVHAYLHVLRRTRGVYIARVVTGMATLIATFASAFYFAVAASRYDYIPFAYGDTALAVLSVAIFVVVTANMLASE
ncbi:MAG: hypothetical protein Q7S96_01620 [bacterium]|nr:hypothetical protein [bacterium]